MPGSPRYDAVIVGSGPNGLAAAITLARAGCKVLVIEGQGRVGGGMRTQEVTLPGFRHDICSAIHPLGLGSPFFQSLPLEHFGLTWIQPPIPLAHPLDDGSAVGLHRSISATAASIGRDGDRWRVLMAPLAADWGKLAPTILGPLSWPPHPLALGRFSLYALWSAVWLSRMLFREDRAAALFAGLAAHSLLPLEQPLSASFGLVLGMLGHAVGWPLPQCGSQAIADAMTAYLRSLGGDVVCGWMVERLDELPPARSILLDVAPRAFLRLAGDQLPPSYRRQLERFRYNPGVCKVDYALAGPVPWQAEECRRAGTVHVGGRLEEIGAAERAIWQGQHAGRPYVLIAQPSLFDDRRAPAGQHTLWAYCHVPHGSTVDMSERIEAQIERFAPGFRDLILARSVRTAAEMEAYNPNYVGGDINGGVQDLRQLWMRPTARRNPYTTPVPTVFLCSSSTPPGGGVHGMCGYHAAQAALRALGA